MISYLKWALAIGGSTVLVLAVLVWLGMSLGSVRSTFTPVLIVGPR